MEETARIFTCHRNTVRSWLGQGLPAIDDRRPLLIRGADLRAFLTERRAKRKRPSGPGEIYCVRCRVPRRPAGDVADYQALTAGMGNLIAICSTCEALMYRRVNLARLDEIRGEVAVTLPQALPRISESDEPSVNSDLE